MGKGSPFHQEIVDYLKVKYPNPQPNTFSLKYSFDNVENVGQGKFMADYVFDGAWVDAIHEEPWMESLGKFIVYGNQIMNEKREFWLIFYAKSLYPKHKKDGRYNKMTEPEFIQEQRRHYSFYKRIAKRVLIDSIKDRIRVFDYESSGAANSGHLVEID